MSFRIPRKNSCVEPPVNYYEPIDQHEIESALNEEISAQISARDKPTSNFMFVAKMEENNNNYDTMSFLDAYEEGGTKDLDL